MALFSPLLKNKMAAGKSQHLLHPKGSVLRLEVGKGFPCPLGVPRIAAGQRGGDSWARGFVFAHVFTSASLAEVLP